MKIFLSLILMLAGFYGYAKVQGADGSLESKKVVFTQKCESEHDQGACEDLFKRAQLMCDNYYAAGCAGLYYIYSSDKVDFYVKNISQKELRKKAVFYLTKACMLGDDDMCQILEKWKMDLEKIVMRNDSLPPPNPIRF